MRLLILANLAVSRLHSGGLWGATSFSPLLHREPSLLSHRAMLGCSGLIWVALGCFWAVLIFSHSLAPFAPCAPSIPLSLFSLPISLYFCLACPSVLICKYVQGNLIGLEELRLSLSRMLTRGRSTPDSDNRV